MLPFGVDEIAAARHAELMAAAAHARLIHATVPASRRRRHGVLGWVTHRLA